MLTFLERNGKLSRCLLEQEIEQLMKELYDDHGHFSSQYLLRKCVGCFFWPTRRARIEQYCRSCFEC